MKTTTLCALALTLLPLAAGNPSSDMSPEAPAEACRVEAALLHPAPAGGLADFRRIQDATGKHLVLVKGSGPAYALHAYTRDAATGQYARRGIYSIVSHVLPLVPSGVAFDEGGLTVTLRRSSDDGKTQLEWQHRFSYEQAEAGIELLADTRWAHYAWRELNHQPFAFWDREARTVSPETPGLWPGESVVLADKPAAPPASCLTEPPRWNGNGSPENRVTRALRSAMRREDWEKNPDTMPFTWYDGWGEELMAEGAEVPEDKLVELWYSAQMNIAFCHNWFCDAAGDNLVFASGMSSGATTTELTAYRWDAQKQVFIRRGTYTICSRIFHDAPTRVGFDEAGMRVELILSSAVSGTTLRIGHHFDYAQPHGSLEVFAADRELAGVVEDEIAGERHSRQWEVTPLGAPQPPATGREDGLILPLPEGGHRHAAMGGALRAELRGGATSYAKVIGSFSPLPDNRITRALNSRHPWRSQGQRNPRAVDWLKKPGSFIPAGQLGELWSAAANDVYYNAQPSWFCDEAGEHLVILSKSDPLHSYVVQVFVWDAARGGFVQRVRYPLACGNMLPISTRTEFLPDGVRLCCMSLYSDDAFPYERVFFIRYQQPADSAE